MNHASLPITGEILFMMATINEFEGTLTLNIITSNPEPTDDIEYEEVYPQCPFPRPDGYENHYLDIPSNPIPYGQYSILGDGYPGIMGDEISAPTSI